jgi:hypothetical protein
MTTIRASRSFPTLRYVFAPFRWFFGSRRRVLNSVAVLLAMIAAPVIWWSIQLMGLPDIGDPFDVEALRSFKIPDKRNAFVLYRQAADRLEPLVASSKAKDEKIDLDAFWSAADPSVRRWVDANREAMELYRQGTDRPDALSPTGPDRIAGTNQVGALYSFHRLALLEASRLEDEGDMAGAWNWYRAALRATYHLGLHGTISARSIAQVWHAQVRGRLATWAVDPRTTSVMIHRALDDAVACGALVPSDSYTLKAAYPTMEQMLDSKGNPGRYVPLMRLRWINDYTQYLPHLPPPEVIEALADAWRFWRREPERARRVMRLAVANWLAYDDLPPERRPKPDPNVSGPFDFFTFGPGAAAGANALSPAAIDLWRETSPEAEAILEQLDLRALRSQEQTSHRALVVLLASELYRRDRGTGPRSPEALVGPYLEQLPDDGAGDASSLRPAGAVR